MAVARQADDTPLAVLLVEDDDAEARRLAEHLEEAEPGCVLRRVGSLAEAEALAGDGDFDLCLLDLGLPDGDDVEPVTRLLRLVDDLPVVALSEGTDALPGPAAATGAVEYLARDQLTARRLAWAVRHVLERDRVRRQRRAAEEKWATVFDASPVPMVVSDAESSRLIEVNDAFVAMFGQSRAEMLGETALELGQWEDPDRRAELIEQVKAEGLVEGEEAWYRDDEGRRGRMLLSCRRLTLSEGDRLLWTVQDITERVRRERALGERIKEQSCLYDISRLLHEDDRPLADRLQAVVERMPAGWQYPDLTVARLRLGEDRFASGEAGGLAATLETGLAADGAEGELTVGYRAPGPRGEGDPFLPEEHRLLEEIAEQVEVEISRHRTRQQMRHLAETMNEAVTIVAPDGTITFANSAARRLFSEEASYVGEDLTAFASQIRTLDGEPCPPERLPFQRVMRTGEPVTGFEHVIVREGGERIVVSVNAAPMRGDGGEIEGVVLTVRDITGQKARQRELEETTRQLHGLLDAAAGIIFRIRLDDWALTYITPNVGAVTGFPADRWTETPDFWAGRVPAEERDRVMETLRQAAAAAGEEQHELEFRIRHADESWHWYRVIARFERDETGEATSVVGTAVDVTARRELENQLRHQALHDPLTGLANRILLDDRLEQGVARARRHEEGLAVLMVDLDRFKRVNDSLGHTAGDRVLEEVARRLEETVREEDTVARFGGDEFCLLLTGIEGRDDLEEVRSRLFDRLARPIRVLGSELTLDVTVGAVLFGGEDLAPVVAVEDPEDLIRYADGALYRAKGRPGSSFGLYEPEPEGPSEASDELAREQALRRALEAGDFEPFYQPLVELETNRIWGVETLARWRHPERGLVPPGQFIALAEETGLIHELGRQLMTRACRDVARWPAGPRERPLVVCLNVSGRQFEGEGMVEQLETCVASSGLDAAQVMVEVTETAITRATERIEELRALGVGVLIDDFGTGYSSLLYLRDLEVDGLKIDMSFVQGLGQGQGNSAIVESTLTLGRSMGLQVIAEGIETDDQLDRLRSMGCALGQGFRYARPMPADEMGELLAAGTVAGG